MKGLSYKDVTRLSLLTMATLLAVVAGVVAANVSELWPRHSLSAPDEALAASDESLPAEVAATVEATTPPPVSEAEEPKAEPVNDAEPALSDEAQVAMILKDPARTIYDDHLPQMPDDGCIPLRSRRVERGMAAFCDSNVTHLKSATAIGIDPVTGAKSAWRLKQPIVKVTSNQYYFIDTLKHSYPYLVPKARKLLTDIGRSFRDSLTARGGGDYRIKVTSLLRTPATVAELRQRNRNAVDSSAHQYATTFDITYAKFICDSPSNPRTIEDLKLLLMEILDDLRQQGRCYVKSERKQACFHITTR